MTRSQRLQRSHINKRKQTKKTTNRIKSDRNHFLWHRTDICHQQKQLKQISSMWTMRKWCEWDACCEIYLNDTQQCYYSNCKLVCLTWLLSVQFKNVQLASTLRRDKPTPHSTLKGLMFYSVDWQVTSTANSKYICKHHACQCKNAIWLRIQQKTKKKYTRRTA